jgi:hypothetical protein
LKASEKGVEWAHQRIDEYTEKIEKLKRKGVVEPRCDSKVSS